MHEVVVSGMVCWEGVKIVGDKEIVEKLVSFVARSRRRSRVCVTSDIQYGVRILLSDKVDCVLKESNVFHKLCLLSSSAQIHVDMDADLVPRFVKHHDKYTTGCWLEDGDVGIKFLLPEC